MLCATSARNSWGDMVRKAVKSCFVVLCLITVLMAGKGFTSEIDHETRDQPRLIDHTCIDLNSAYKNIRQHPRYRETIYQLKPDGTLAEYLNIIYSDSYGYLSYAGKTGWDRFNIESPYWQRFTSCTLTKIKNGRHFYATYHYRGHIAGTEAWITSDGKRVKKVIRRYPRDDEYFPFPIVVSLFDYGPKAVQPPTKYTCGGGPCRL